MSKDYFEDMEVEFAMAQDDAIWAEYYNEINAEKDRLTEEFRMAMYDDNMDLMKIALQGLEEMCEYDRIDILIHEHKAYKAMKNNE